MEESSRDKNEGARCRVVGMGGEEKPTTRARGVSGDPGYICVARLGRERRNKKVRYEIEALTPLELETLLGDKFASS